jgi:hypothetical protein
VITKIQLARARHVATGIRNLENRYTFGKSHGIELHNKLVLVGREGGFAPPPVGAGADVLELDDCVDLVAVPEIKLSSLVVDGVG